MDQRRGGGGGGARGGEGWARGSGRSRAPLSPLARTQPRLPRPGAAPSPRPEPHPQPNPLPPLRQGRERADWERRNGGWEGRGLET